VARRQQPPPRSIRAEYVEHGAQAFYAQHGETYSNPHEERVRAALARCVAQWRLDLSTVLDLACGSGEVSVIFRKLGATRIDGADPFTNQAYRRRTGQDALEVSFEQIAAGALAGRRYSLVVCSYALHLLEPSRLPALLYELRRIAPALLILSPHKRPQIREEWGWRLEAELYEQRVRARLFHQVALA
jgi:hypothetical protein